MSHCEKPSRRNRYIEKTKLRADWALLDVLSAGGSRAIISLVTLEDLSSLDFAEITNAVGATSHSRRMMGLLLDCAKDIKNGQAVARACMSPEFAQAAKDTQNEDAAFILLSRNELTPERVLCYARDAIEGKGSLSHMSVGELAFGSPLIGDKVPGLLKELAAKRRNETAVVNGFRCTSWGNPALHGRDKEPTGEAKISHRFLLSAATFGDLQNPHVVDALQDGLLNGPRDASAIIGALVVRDDVPKDLIIGMSESADYVEDCLAIANMPAHRSLVRSGDCYPLVGKQRGFLKDIPCVISPEATAYVEKLVETTDGGALAKKLRRESVLRSEHCPKDYYERIKKAGNHYLESYDFLRDSPWARDYLLSKKGEGALGELGRFLNGHPNDKGRLHFWSLPAMPVDQISPSDTAGVFQDKFLAAAHIVGAIRSPAYADKLAYDLTVPKYWHAALLFSPATSGRRLEQIAKIHPGLSGLAALHPNGDELPMALVPKEFHSFVEKHKRAAPSLPGRGGDYGDAVGKQIVL